MVIKLESRINSSAKQTKKWLRFYRADAYVQGLLNNNEMIGWYHCPVGVVSEFFRNDKYSLVIIFGRFHARNSILHHITTALRMVKGEGLFFRIAAITCCH